MEYNYYFTISIPISFSIESDDFLTKKEAIEAVSHIKEDSELIDADFGIQNLHETLFYFIKEKPQDIQLDFVTDEYGDEYPDDFEPKLEEVKDE